MGEIPARYRSVTPGQALAHLVEEMGEVLAAAGKTQRWGPRSYNPELPEEERETNLTWLLREIADLERAILAFHDQLNRTKHADWIPGEPPFDDTGARS